MYRIVLHLEAGGSLYFTTYLEFTKAQAEEAVVWLEASFPCTVGRYQVIPVQ